MFFLVLLATPPAAPEYKCLQPCTNVLCELLLFVIFGLCAVVSMITTVCAIASRIQYKHLLKRMQLYQAQQSLCPISSSALQTQEEPIYENMSDSEAYEDPYVLVDASVESENCLYGKI
ncbi:uncharacterized protein LOC122251905 [Penaeus japonicus]|uniref:uncharacterized protein LOC122251905 n=1 Tax=Penaeus japonicus TaxID=27405 RepID=UPI001C716478|nr:uncharacterized protein LOC122251905 [Penaeus japonicus]